MKNYILIALLALAGAMSAQATPLLNYQGKLLDTNGVPFNGLVDVVINVYSQSVGGSPVYSESMGNVVVQDGLYSFNWGASFAPSIDEQYIEVMLDGEPLEPRRMITAIPLARQALGAIESDPVWGLEKGMYATGTPLYAFTELDPRISESFMKYKAISSVNIIELQAYNFISLMTQGSDASYGEVFSDNNGYINSVTTNTTAQYNGYKYNSYLAIINNDFIQFSDVNPLYEGVIDVYEKVNSVIITGRDRPASTASTFGFVRFKYENGTTNIVNAGGSWPSSTTTRTINNPQPDLIVSSIDFIAYRYDNNTCCGGPWEVFSREIICRAASKIELSVDVTASNAAKMILSAIPQSQDFGQVSYGLVNSSGGTNGPYAVNQVYEVSPTNFPVNKIIISLPDPVSNVVTLSAIYFEVSND